MANNIANRAAATADQNQVKPNRAHVRKVCVLVYNGLNIFDYGLAVEVFLSSGARLEDWYDFQVIAIDPAPVVGEGNVKIDASGDLAALSNADLILIPGWRGTDEKIPDTLKTALLAAHSTGVKLASICSGVFVLAQCGLLDGKNATTHWHYIEALRKQYPQINIQENTPFVEDDNILSSGGTLSGVNMCLQIVKEDYGDGIADIIARRLSVANTSTGLQNLNASGFMLGPNHGSISPLMEKIRDSINEEWGIERMAGEAHASARTLQRRFKDATGHSPHMWLTLERIALAKDLLETTHMNIQKIADITGLKTPETFRHHFKRQTGISPTQFRAQFIRKEMA